MWQCEKQTLPQVDNIAHSYHSSACDSRYSVTQSLSLTRLRSSWASSPGSNTVQLDELDKWSHLRATCALLHPVLRLPALSLAPANIQITYVQQVTLPASSSIRLRRYVREMSIKNFTSRSHGSLRHLHWHTLTKFSEETCVKHSNLKTFDKVSSVKTWNTRLWHGWRSWTWQERIWSARGPGTCRVQIHGFVACSTAVMNYRWIKYDLWILWHIAMPSVSKDFMTSKVHSMSIEFLLSLLLRSDHWVPWSSLFQHFRKGTAPRRRAISRGLSGSQETRDNKTERLELHTVVMSMSAESCTP